MYETTKREHKATGSRDSNVRPVHREFEVYCVDCPFGGRVTPDTDHHSMHEAAADLIRGHEEKTDHTAGFAEVLIE